ncbi:MULTISPECIES: MaoC/PaaZ C-terminal domain-containing protein [Streptomyces]|uniref:MaoC/PaaZ C-terminal domain-containing protein n=1 Tax=Streptomyces nondiastaticus TaxID=3154512 RepID=A0ABW6TT24_9ACTN|nr:MaoC/PaaZ C-terminal domain-containing protein [Streptomyces sp. VNUA116]WKU48147.1 MaoC/PaaZ C-terminal domain-containing protein [Streptomyces sp. VNUA116]
MNQPPPAPRAACPAYGFTIEPSEVADFRRLLHRADRLVPAFFLCRALPPAVRAVVAAEGARTDPAAVRHAGQLLRLRRRPETGERLTAHAVVEATGDYGFRRAVVLRLTLCDAAGAEVAASLTTLTTGPADGRGRLPARPAAAPHGPALLRWRTRVPDDLPDRYARASGDDNPIHTDASAARRAGLPGVVLHGMATLHLAAAGLTDRLLDGDESRWSEVRTRFTRPVRPGDDIEFAVHSCGGGGEAERAGPGPRSGQAVRSARTVLALTASVGGRPVLKDTFFTGVRAVA